MVYSQKANSSVDDDFKGELGIPEKIAENYEAQMSKRVESRTGHKAMSWGVSARRDGAPPVKILGENANQLIGDLRSKSMAKIMSGQSIEQMPGIIRDQSNKLNDGFFLTDAPAALAASYFIKPEFAFKAMDFLRTVQLESFSAESKDFFWNLPGESRFIKVTDTAVLQPVGPGVWYNAEMISFPDLAKDTQS